MSGVVHTRMHFSSLLLLHDPILLLQLIIVLSDNQFNLVVNLWSNE